MMQTWNKFCFQGGMVEVRAQLPGAVSKKSKNPDVAGGPNARTQTGAFYPTWPGIWMMGNLGRAIFSGSTSRMWPFSYNECNPDAFDPTNQRISACESNPGHGLNPNQGRGAPEIDLLEGGGVAISSSIQIGPGLKVKYRRIPVNLTIPNEYKDCVYNGACQTPGANLPNVPTALYKPRKYQTWYKGLRYSSNSFCAMDPKEKQTYAQISAAIVNITKDTCSVETCPASRDVQADLSFIPNDKTKARWGINSKGTCAAIMNNYMGSFLCDPDSTNPMCETPRNATTPKTNVMEPFAYQMDALSANWGVHVGAYTGFLTYQVEWVMGDTGYLRWMLYGNPIFEIPAESVVKGPQSKIDPNPQLTFPEEPMYLIFNVALSNQWGAMPPNAGKGPCGMMVGKPEIDNQTKLVCDSFPMYMKIDYIRVYQDKSPNSTMAIGCDPKTHPTRQWIFDHIKEYEDDQNPYVEVDGGAYCRNDLDCMIPFNTTVNFATGNCVEWRCKCNTKYWGGPRCTTALKITDLSTAAKQAPSYGPPLYLSITIGSISIVMTCAIIAFCTRRRRRKDVELQQKLAKMKTELTIEKASLLPSSDFDEIELARNSNATPQSRYQPLSAKGA
jgi:beta-glucan synthesis-associated protein KRE6